LKNIHEPRLSPGGVSISKVLGKYNSGKYMVATEREELRKFVEGNFINVPLLRMGHNFFILDHPCQQSVDASLLMKQQKIELMAKNPKMKENPPSHEVDLQSLKRKEQEQEEEEEEEPSPLKKKKKK
jgi:hypothetical protein